MTGVNINGNETVKPNRTSQWAIFHHIKVQKATRPTIRHGLILLW